MAFVYVAYLYTLAALHTIVSSSRLPGIPTIPFEASNGGGTYSLSDIKSIIVDAEYADWTDKNGETMVPPSLREFGRAFGANLYDIWGLENLSQPVVSAPQPDSVFLTISENASHQYASGEASSEGYTLEVTTSGITIRGASPLGVWWGTRSLLHLAILGERELPLGKSVDSPAWKTRGMLLDVARRYYPPQFIIEMCSYMSFFKQNTLLLHLSDGLYNNANIYSREQSLSLYARFRLWSEAPEVEGLNNFKNESYTRNDFQYMQVECAGKGVTIVPEIESPGHALPIVQWKPELGLSTDLSVLNVSHPDAVSTMKTVWRTFFDWFDTKTVYIGASEYTTEDGGYNHFVNQLSGFIRNNGSKSVRIWGTLPPKPDSNPARDSSLQYFEENTVFDYNQDGHSVINSDATFHVVNKWSESFPQKVNLAKTFHGNPATGGPWEPTIHDTNNATNNPEKPNQNIIGAIAPLWNDYGPNATVYSEAYYAWREGIPALADKQWGGTLLSEEFITVLPILHTSIPAQNLESPIASTGPVIFRYDRESWAQNRRARSEENPGPPDKVADLSDNGYDAFTNCSVSANNTIAIDGCSLKTELGTKGRNYALTIRLYISQFGTDAVLISGQESALMLTPTITLFASENYYRLNATVPLNTWVDLSIVGRNERTFAGVQKVRLGDPFVARSDEEFKAVLGVNGQSFVWAPIAIEAPIMQIEASNANWTGHFGGMLLTTDV
ncbi:hypothetical protein NUW58_g4133 [Xylaria curta]|uniref:Uncharacterized protein n=1 Tax=Xylaria curta TaxID=42375 RepID=A0ACC1P969_9PEZI|nr:hypothetical protein NUW58_g4133 [Xylaria curta]